MQSLLKKIRGKRGSITVLAAALMFVLIGMVALVTDVGFLYVNKSQLQNMTDAGALAGAQEYFVNQAQVVSYATDYALNKNGKTGDIVSVDIDTTDKKITVTAKRTVDLFFAKIFNMQTANVSAVSAAKIVGVSSIGGSSPFGLAKDDFKKGETYTLKVDPSQASQGNFHSLRLGGNGNRTVSNNLIYGYDGTLSVGDKIWTQPGNATGPISQGVTARVAINPMIIVPILVEDWATIGSGRSEVTIAGFAAFYLNGNNSRGNGNGNSGNNGSNFSVTGQFIDYVTAAEIGSGGGDYGLYGTKLVKP